MLIGITAPTSDHSAVDNIKFTGEKDLQVSVKFCFVSDKAKSFNVWFDDKNYKGSHAGHICQATISPTGVNLADRKQAALTCPTDSTIARRPTSSPTTRRRCSPGSRSVCR
ncbi:MAG: hypothetical protein JNN17_21105 [Verrucomicrobiaceae bacterium]|nr:hypothetical protein [Verrucomicrobiaceae bacterium]